MEKKKKPERIPTLSDDLLLQIVRMALKNADSLILDADLLYSNARYPRAAAIYQLAMEEVGKALLAHSYLIFHYKDYSSHIKEFNNCFFNHLPKSEKSARVDFMIGQMIYEDSPDKMKNFVLEGQGVFINRSLKEMDEMRNNCFYAGYINGKIIDPMEYINEKAAATIQDIAKLRYNSAKGITGVSVKHLNELREHMKKNPIDENELIEEFVKKYIN